MLHNKCNYIHPRVITLLTGGAYNVVRFDDEWKNGVSVERIHAQNAHKVRMTNDQGGSIEYWHDPYTPSDINEYDV